MLAKEDIFKLLCTLQDHVFSSQGSSERQTW